MIRNTGPGKRLLAAGIVLILGMTGCGTDNELSLTGTEETGIEVMATVDFTEEAATGEMHRMSRMGMPPPGMQSRLRRTAWRDGRR